MTKAADIIWSIDDDKYSEILDFPNLSSNDLADFDVREIDGCDIIFIDDRSLQAYLDVACYV